MSPSSELRAEPSFWLRPWSLDLRSLALFRIHLGLVMLYDLGFRLLDFDAMYAEPALVSVDLIRHLYGWSHWFWTPFLVSGDSVWQAAAFALTIAAAIAFTLGWWTRTATVVLWICFLSLHLRNPTINSGGDELLRTLLFWGMFLPLGQVWSFDARGQSTPGEMRIFTAGTAALVLQIVIVYVVTALYKCNPVWFRGDTLLIALRPDQFGTEWGAWFLQFPELLRVSTWGALAVELVLPVLLVIPWLNAWWRMAAIVGFIALHVSIDLFLNVGLFSPVCIAAWLALLPTEFWRCDTVQSLLARFDAADTSEDATDAAAPTPAVDASEASATSESPTPWDYARYAWQGVAAIVIAYLLWWNIDTLNKCYLARSLGIESKQGAGGWIMPQSLRAIGRHLWLKQYWAMFGEPGYMTAWWSIRGRLRDGTEIDPLREGRPYSADKPPHGMDGYPNHRWLKHFRSLMTQEGANFQQETADYLRQSWNERHPPERQIVSLDMFLVWEEIQLIGDRPYTENVRRLQVRSPSRD